MASKDVLQQTDIITTLFDVIGLDRAQSRRYMQWDESLEKSWRNNPLPIRESLRITTAGGRRWIHAVPIGSPVFDPATAWYSYLCYNKGGSTLINNILNSCEQEGITLEQLGLASSDGNDWEGTGLLANTLVIPYKDPLDKFISAFFTNDPILSAVFHTQKHTEETNNIVKYTDYFVDHCYDQLDEFMNQAIKQELVTGHVEGDKLVGLFQNQVDPTESTSLSRYDHHYYPIHIILLILLWHYKGKQFKLVGLNLDNNPDTFIFKDLLEGPCPQHVKQKLLHRQSANNDVAKIAATKWKSNNGPLAQRIIDKFLSNDYLLIEHLAKNSMKWHHN